MPSRSLSSDRGSVLVRLTSKSAIQPVAVGVLPGIGGAVAVAVGAAGSGLGQADLIDVGQPVPVGVLVPIGGAVVIRVGVVREETQVGLELARQPVAVGVLVLLGHPDPEAAGLEAVDGDGGTQLPDEGLGLDRGLLARCRGPDRDRSAHDGEPDQDREQQGQGRAAAGASEHSLPRWVRLAGRCYDIRAWSLCRRMRAPPSVRFQHATTRRADLPRLPV